MDNFEPEQRPQSKIIFIVHWSYSRCQDDRGYYYFHIDAKEVFECESMKDFISRLKKVMSERKISKEEIKSIKIITGSREIISDDIFFKKLDDI